MLQLDTLNGKLGHFFYVAYMSTHWGSNNGMAPSKSLSELMMAWLLTYICIIQSQWIDSLRLNVTYMHTWTMSLLVQKMACQLVSIIPSFKPMLTHYIVNGILKQVSVKFWSQYQHFLSRMCIWKYFVRNIRTFVSASMCYRLLNVYLFPWKRYGPIVIGICRKY